MNYAKPFDFPPPPVGKFGWPWTNELLRQTEKISEDTTRPRISIVTPSYNQGQFLEETIRSVLLQGYPNLEYIIIDGGSTDKSVEIIERYAPWISYWVSEPDRGQSHAINKGFARSTGNIMAWLNSDDAYTQGAFTQIVRALNNEQQALIIGSTFNLDASNPTMRTLDQRKPSWVAMAYEMRTFPQPGVFWTRDLWDIVGAVDDDLHFVMDYDLWLRMRPLAKREILLDTALAYCHIHHLQKGQVAQREGSLSRFTQERVQVSFRAALSRDEKPLVWLLRIWLRRLFSALRTRSLTRLTGSNDHRLALSLILRGRVEKRANTIK